MKRTLLITASLALAILVLAFTVSAQGNRHGRGGGKGRSDSFARMYDTKTVETIRGEVTGVETVTGKGRSGGVHLMVKTDKETLSVHLGPSWYLDDQKIRIATGDQVDITGSRVTYEGNPAIIAAKITRGNETTEPAR